jgi:hypothetical protein
MKLSASSSAEIKRLFSYITAMNLEIIFNILYIFEAIHPQKVIYFYFYPWRI